MSGPSLRVIGVGNPSRGDDGIGPAAVASVAADPRLSGVEAIVASGDLSDLVVTWRSDEDVVIVDAMVGDRPPGTVVVLDGLVERPPAGMSPLSSHGFGLAATIELARRLDLLPRTLTIMAVQVDRIDVEGELSAPARLATAAVVDAIATLANDRRIS